mmetsp:Transcript_11045/g.37536  ORF Transcript_11045/g.37536 Transcript_11045/m.37536 type:complete len:559 (-) Transcript_11045:101-1777(-)
MAYRENIMMAGIGTRPKAAIACCVLLLLLAITASKSWQQAAPIAATSVIHEETGLDANRWVGNFPFEGSSPVASFERRAAEKVKRLKEGLYRLKRGLQASSLQARGGLKNSISTNEGRKDSFLCAIPGIADAFGSMFDMCAQGRRAGMPAGVYSRPLMAVPPPSPEEIKEQEEEEEERRLRMGAEAVDEAEDKMGDYYNRSLADRLFTQPKDIIAPAVGGRSQRRNWQEVQRIFDDVMSVLLVPNVTWRDLRWKHSGGATRCGDDDPTCGSDLTLHEPYLKREEEEQRFYSPFAGSPILPPPHAAGGAVVECLNPPTCSSAPQLGERKAAVKNHGDLFRSWFSGVPVSAGSHSPLGGRVACSDPTCGSAPTLHEPRIYYEPLKRRILPFPAGSPIRRPQKPLGDKVPWESGPRVLNPPLSPPPVHHRIWFPFPAGSPIRPRPPAASQPGSRGPASGPAPAAAPAPAPAPAPVHPRVVHAPLGPVKRGPGSYNDYLGRIPLPWEDVHYRAHDLHPWMFKQVKGQELRRLPCRGRYCRSRARSRRGRSYEAPVNVISAAI